MTPIRPRLLYLSPVIPSFTGNGLAMRAARVLEALARQYEVELRVVPIYPSPSATVPEAIARLCHAVSIGDAVRPAAAVDVVHVFRLVMLPAAEPYLALDPRPFLQLDLDDIESVSRERTGMLAMANGDAAVAASERRAAAEARAEEDRVLGAFDRVFVGSEGDRRRVEGRRPRAEVVVLPNAVELPAATPRVDRDPFRFLFVGTLGYYPNADAALYLCRSVVPRLRAAASRPFRVDVVGGGSFESLRSFASEDVDLAGAVPDVGPWYARAHAAVVPLRAGGGTRIKVLEAFAHRRPVVSTTVGAEGIDAEPGRDLLIGDTPDDFAARCLDLMEDWSLGEALAERALAVVRSRHTPEAIGRLSAHIAGNRPNRGAAAGGSDA